MSDFRELYFIKIMRNVICCLRSQSTFCGVFWSVFKSHYLKNFIEIVLLFLPVQSKTNILDVNINFTGNIYFLDSIAIMVKWSQNPLILTLLEHRLSQRMFFQYSFHRDT